MKTLSLLVATTLAVVSLASCGLSPAAKASDRKSYSSGEQSSGVPFLGKNCLLCNILTGGRSSWR